MKHLRSTLICIASKLSCLKREREKPLCRWACKRGSPIRGLSFIAGDTERRRRKEKKEEPEVMRLESTKTEVEGARTLFLNPVCEPGIYTSRDEGDAIRERSKEHLLQMKQLFDRLPCLYDHKTYMKAARIYDSLITEGTEDPVQILLGETEAKEEDEVDFADEHDKRLTFNLVFQTLKYQKFLDDMLKDCHFFERYPEFKDEYSQVMILLSDFKERKFQARIPKAGEEDEEIEALKNIEDALFVCKTKLNAALARSRIKARVLSIDHLLPESVRQNDKIGGHMHMYCWVNMIKTTMDEVIDLLCDMGFSRVDDEVKLTRHTYYLDHQCHDMLCFPHEEREFLESHYLLNENHLIVQDKSSCVGVHSVRALMNEGDDILFVNADGGLSIGHLASLTHQTDSIIFCFGVKTEKNYDSIIENLDRIGVQSRVKLYMEDLLDVEPFDDRLKHVKVVLLVATCSRSGVANPVNFIVSEGEDLNILKDLSLGYTDENKLSEMVLRHNSVLKHALKFPRVQAVVYTTRSLLEAENEAVVTRSLEYINAALQMKTPFRVAPPVLPLSDKDIESENPLNGKFLRYPPCSFMSGCFVATITREADDPKEAAKDILARAAARGIFNVDAPSKGAKKKKKKKKKEAQDTIPEEGSDSGVSHECGQTCMDISHITSGCMDISHITSGHKSHASHMPSLPSSTGDEYISQNCQLSPESNMAAFVDKYCQVPKVDNILQKLQTQSRGQKKIKFEREQKTTKVTSNDANVNETENDGNDSSQVDDSIDPKCDDDSEIDDNSGHTSDTKNKDCREEGYVTSELLSDSTVKPKNKTTKKVLVPESPKSKLTEKDLIPSESPRKSRKNQRNKSRKTISKSTNRAHLSPKFMRSRRIVDDHKVPEYQAVVKHPNPFKF